MFKVQEITQTFHLPYYEIRDKNNQLIGCIAGIVHDLIPGARFEPSPRMVQCWEKAKLLLAESGGDKEKEVFDKYIKEQARSHPNFSHLSGEDFENEYCRLLEKKKNSSTSIDQFWIKRAQEKRLPIQGLESTETSIRGTIMCQIEAQVTASQGQEEKCQKWMHYFLYKNIGNHEDYFTHCFIKPQTSITIQSETGERATLTKKDFIDLFISRNEAMASRIFRGIKNHKFPYVSLGLGHCLGENGVPQILREKYGLTIETVESPSRIHIPINKLKFARF